MILVDVRYGLQWVDLVLLVLLRSIAQFQGYKISLQPYAAVESSSK